MKYSKILYVFLVFGFLSTAVAKDKENKIKGEYNDLNWSYKTIDYDIGDEDNQEEVDELLDNDPFLLTLQDALNRSTEEKPSIKSYTEVNSYGYFRYKGPKSKTDNRRVTRVLRRICYKLGFSAREFVHLGNSIIDNQVSEADREQAHIDVKQLNKSLPPNKFGYAMNRFDFGSHSRPERRCYEQIEIESEDTPKLVSLKEHSSTRAEVCKNAHKSRSKSLTVCQKTPRGQTASFYPHALMAEKLEKEEKKSGNRFCQGGWVGPTFVAGSCVIGFGFYY